MRLVLSIVLLCGACRTPIAGPTNATASTETKAVFLVRRSQERSINLAQQSAWDDKKNAKADLDFDLRDLAVATQARSLFRTHCAGCHGGRGEGMKTAVSVPALGGFGHRMGMTMSGGKMGRGMFRLIRDGRAIMPAFKDRLANEQIWLLVRYLSSL
jgi:mono/diheme cytochrome c family protein